MANVIHHGQPKRKIARHVCKGCDSTVDYTGDDTCTDPRNQSYVVCPVCGAWIDTHVLNWQYPTPHPHDPDQELIWVEPK